MILTQAAEVKWQCANITDPFFEWTKYARYVTVYDTGRSSFAGLFKKNIGA